MSVHAHFAGIFPGRGPAKASVIDEKEQLWIAKFPSRHDDYNIEAWEFVTYQLAIDAHIDMAECRIERFNSHYHTFLTKRFDRTPESRRHFTSAMTQLDYNLALEVIDFFQLDYSESDEIKSQVLESVSKWQEAATNAGISRSEQRFMASAFNI